MAYIGLCSCDAAVFRRACRRVAAYRVVQRFIAFESLYLHAVVVSVIPVFAGLDGATRTSCRRALAGLWCSTFWTLPTSRARYHSYMGACCQPRRNAGRAALGQGFTGRGQDRFTDSFDLYRARRGRASFCRCHLARTVDTAVATL